MGRFLIIRVIKEHNADGYQNYDKWHKLLYIRPIHGYYIVLPIEQQFWNFTNLDVWKKNVYTALCDLIPFLYAGSLCGCFMPWLIPLYAICFWKMLYARLCA